MNVSKISYENYASFVKIILWNNNTVTARNLYLAFCFMMTINEQLKIGEILLELGDTGLDT
jgi:hypothetical protein